VPKMVSLIGLDVDEKDPAMSVSNAIVSEEELVSWYYPIPYWRGPIKRATPHELELKSKMRRSISVKHGAPNRLGYRTKT